MTTTTDPLFAQQWHLSVIGNIAKVWDDYTGAGVTVAVYDDGLQFTHSDLQANYDSSKHFSFGGITYAPVPQTTDDAHGTACAGLIAAVADNGKGGAGVAYGATLTGLDYLNDLQFAYDWDSQTTSALYDAAMRWAAGFDIMSNSWGTLPDFSYQLNLNEAGNSSAVDAGHFAWVSAIGRGGLGTIVVKAAGNETMNANGDGANVSRHTITVAATEADGVAAYYSNHGSAILLSAPAASVTTDLAGSQGYAAGDYTTTFGGTSAATPVIAGVTALMLDANAGLGWRDVQSILAMSASHTGSALGSGPGATEVGRWLTMGGEQWNAGGSIYHMSYGFGMVDAYAAVRMAEVWSRLYGAAHTSANELHVSKAYGGSVVAIADTDGNNSTPEARISLGVTEDIEIDSVQVTLSIDHSYGQDLVIYLRSPTGEQIALFDREGGSASGFGATVFDGGVTWTFAGEAFRGMGSQGTWQILVHDRAAGDTGTVTEARLDFYGSANSANDVYHFTDDFRMLRNLQADRAVIGDANGGTDWLNFAAMAGNLFVNMAAGGAVKVNGTQLATIEAGVAEFERLQAGDGADTLFGNVLSNRIFGGRGNDRLAGGKGADLLVGESGGDRLTGGGGADIFEFRRGFGQDRITDWTDGSDTLRLDDALWGGGMTATEVVAGFGAVISGSVVLSFSAAMVLTLNGVSDLNALVDDITIV
ncbi:S8 family serine peptidase [Tabrizicola oligotrophica]|uniref:S8 family serine peptidase n=1 Tax=Tabrizicola oligotrophica TaxID=2710650 RepID=A0A6M0QQI5_9RHOB|nr:S8 family serine peptidase [Tabrizicola oligotrophica]NEY89707.1 S8 family serine peptidase [Tabrizicola oligotrophica]